MEKRTKEDIEYLVDHELVEQLKKLKFGYDTIRNFLNSDEPATEITNDIMESYDLGDLNDSEIEELIKSQTDKWIRVHLDPIS